MKKKQVSRMTVEEVIEEALRREHQLIAFYQSLISEVGDEAQPLMNCLLQSHHQHFDALREFEEEVALRRDMTLAMAY